MHMDTGTFRVSQVLVRFSRHTPRFFVNPDRPSENSPYRFPCVGFQTVDTVAICICTVFTVDAVTGLYQDFRKCGLPCGLRRSLCTLQ